MRFSDILGNAFHQITLPGLNAQWVDIFFTACAHHFHRSRQCRHPALKNYHDQLFRSHLWRMMEIIYVSGDFRRAIDPSGQGLNKRESWNPERSRFGIFDPHAFDQLGPDDRYGLGKSHPNDVFIYENRKAA
jgi:hypothetical protein